MSRQFISIIIPVYNIEKYVEKCVHSIQMQTYKNIEIILVDDGSKDSSGFTCDILASKDSRIKVLHQKNQGLSCARNNGLEISQGYYIAFLDGDDYWQSSHILNEIVDKINKDNFPEVVLCGFIKKNINTGKKNINTITPIIENEIGELKKKLLKSGKYFNSAYTKIYRKDFLMKHKLRFPEGRMNEDLIWSRKVLNLSNSISIYKNPVVVYQIGRTESITSNFSNKNYRDILEQMTEDYDEIMKLSIDEQKNGLAFWADQCCWYFSFFNKSGLSLKETIKENELAFNIIKYALSMRANIINKMIKIFGKTLTIKTLIMYQHILERHRK